MDSRVRNIGIAAAAVLVILAAVFLPPSLAQPYSFEQGLAELDSIWASGGTGFFMEDTELETLSRSTILELKSETLDFKKRIEKLSDSEDKQALLALSNVYFARLNVFLAAKELSAASSAYSFSGDEPDSEVCAALPLIEENVSSFDSFLEEVKKFDEKVNAFADAFPEQFVLSDAFNPSNIASLEQSAEANLLDLQIIRGACA